MPNRPLPADDLAHILTHTRDIFPALTGQRIFLTGGTGFFGHWLLESLLHANRELSLNTQATVLTRNAAAFRSRSPHIANDPAITLLEGDIRTFPFTVELHSHIIHAATDSGGQQANRPPEDLYAEILEGTRRVLHFATHTSQLQTPNPAHQPTRLLYTSTGAVYGRSTQLLHTPETCPVPQLPPNSYEAAKRASELLCLNAPGLQPIIQPIIQPIVQPIVQPVIARCFAFVGPHLPLDAHFAIGNFIADALAGRPIHITGDGSPRRSWLYMSDLAIWLWTLLLRGEPGAAYNVGSDHGMTIAEAAQLTLESVPHQHSIMPASIHIAATPNPNAPLNSYVPAINLARDQLNLKVTVPLPEALRRTAIWHKAT